MIFVWLLIRSLIFIIVTKVTAELDSLLNELMKVPGPAVHSIKTDTLL